MALKKEEKRTAARAMPESSPTRTLARASLQPPSMARYTSEVVRAASRAGVLEEEEEEEESSAAALQAEESHEQPHAAVAKGAHDLGPRAEVEKAIGTAFEPDVADYIVDICRNWTAMESRAVVHGDLFDRQTMLNRKMRSILIDWLWDVAKKFKIQPETMGLTVQLIDRCIQDGPVIPRHKLQLWGTTCMLVACKYEEIYFPEINDFVYITDKAYSKSQFLSMESKVVNTLKFDLALPTPTRFMVLYCQHAVPDRPEVAASGYAIFRILSLDVTFSQARPSQIGFALAALGIAWNKLAMQSDLNKFNPWEGQYMQAVSGRAAAQLVQSEQYDAETRLQRLELFAGQKRTSATVQSVHKSAIAYLTNHQSLYAPMRRVNAAYKKLKTLTTPLEQLGFLLA